MSNDFLNKVRGKFPRPFIYETFPSFSASRFESTCSLFVHPSDGYERGNQSPFDLEYDFDKYGKDFDKLYRNLDITHVNNGFFRSGF
jgi:hypothetical protein